MKQAILRFRTWINCHRTSTMIIAGAVGVAAVGNIALLLVGPQLPPLVPDIVVKKPKEKFYSPLTGLEVADKAALTKPVTGIIIENSMDARPQSGLKQGEVVYEAVAEGGITRFLVLYQQNKPGLIGPVRSIRPYYIDWYAPWDASMIHVGGSSKALKEIRNGSYRDLDQFFNDSAYWRASDRYAPHNVYTNFKRIDALNKKKKYSSSNPTGFLREDTKKAPEVAARTINVHISSPTFDSSYTYDAAKNYYVRSQGGAKHVDREKGAITPQIVIVMNVQEKTQFEDTYRQVISTTGSGKATIFQNGEAIKATWKKSSKKSQIQFFDADDKEIALARGQTWITAISNKGSVSWKK